jgi:hypothetical protein
MWVLDRIHPPINYVKIDKWDTWSMDHTLAQHCVAHAQTTAGNQAWCPLVDDEDVPEHCVAQRHRPKKTSGTLMKITSNAGTGSWAK